MRDSTIMTVLIVTGIGVAFWAIAKGGAATEASFDSFEGEPPPPPPPPPPPRSNQILTS